MKTETISGGAAVEHTATPWYVATSYDDEGRRVEKIADRSNGTILCTMEQWAGSINKESEANSDFLVKAVNCHDEMLSALKRGREKLIVYGKAFKGDKELHETLIPMWEAAIAKAEA